MVEPRSLREGGSAETSKATAGERFHRRAEPEVLIVRRHLSALATVVLLLSDVPSPADNLLQNPGFERVDDTGQAVGWTRGQHAETITDAAVAHSGERCGKARFDDGLAQQLDIEPGAAYRITGWIRRVSPGGAEVPKIKVYFLTAQGKRASVTATQFQGVRADRWLQWESIVMAPATATVMNLTLRGFFGGSEFFYWDDLAVERIEAPDWPPWEKTPDLDGMTVVVPDLADVWTDALLRIPPRSLAPMDGMLNSSAISRGHDFRVELAALTPINYLLVHTMQPLQTLSNARVVGVSDDGEHHELVVTGEGDELVTSERFDTTPVRELLIEVPDDETVCMSEIQAFELTQRSAREGTPVRMGLARGEVPGSMTEHLRLARPREQDRGSLIAGDAGAGQIAMPGGAYMNIFALPAGGEYGVAAVTLELAVADAGDEGVLEICMMQPDELDLDIAYATASDRGPDVLARMTAEHQYPRNYATIFRTITRVHADKPLRVTFDIPDTLFADGEPVWLSLRPRTDMTLDLSRSSLIVSTLTPARTLAEYVPRLERVLRRLYSNETEAHPFRDYRHKYIGRYIERVLALDPNNEPADLILNHVAGRRMPVKLERPGPADAPDWAVWTHEALLGMHAVPVWWLEHRQQADGQLGGHINDDGEFSDRWPTDYLITGDERIRDALQKLADVAWRMSGGKGYTVGSRDVEHAAEDQSCTQPQVLLTRYGSPRAMERLMKMSRYVDFWTAINDVGRRQFKSFMFTSDRIWDDPPNDVDQQYCTLALVGAGHAVWYADLPELRRLFLEEAESWRLATISTDKGKPAGKIPNEIKFSNSEIMPYAPYNRSNPVLKNRPALYMGYAGTYVVTHFLNGASWLTGDDKYAAAMRLDDPSDEERIAAAEAALELYNREPPPPPSGPEKRYSIAATEATQVEAPLRQVRDGALGAAGRDGQAGAATFTIRVPEAGRYAVWGLVGRSEPDDTSSNYAGFFVYVDDQPLNRLQGGVKGDQWREMTTSGCYELEAGEHTIRLTTRTPGSAIKEIGFTSRYSLDGTWSPHQSEDTLYRAWRITGDRKWLIEQLREVVRQQRRLQWLATEGEPCTDRVNWAGERLLGRIFLGETTAQKSHVPGHWISWEGGGTDFAALVVDAAREHLKVILYSFADRPLDMKMRVWRLPHGRYTVRIGVDRDNDWSADETLSRDERELARFDAIELTARPRTQSTWYRAAHGRLSAK